ncbi:MAG: CopD family protein [Actinomycetota bacterium]
MNATRPSARPALGWLFTLTVIGLVGSFWAPTAYAADNTRVSSTPEDGATVQSSPTKIDIVFKQALGAGGTVNMTCTPTGATAGAVVALGSVQLLADGKTLRAPLVGSAPKGQCTVAWSVKDTNLQPNGSGAFSFTVANDPAPSTTSTLPFDEDTTTTAAKTAKPVKQTSAGPSTESTAAGNASKGPLALFRLASNLGLAILFGSLVVIAIAWPEGVEYIITVRFLRSTWFFTIATTFLFTGALASNLTGKGLGSTLLPTGWGDLLDSVPGKAAILRMVFVLAAGYVVTRPERAIDPGSQIPALVPAGIAVATMAFSREQFELIDFTIGTVHALAMAVWFGGLVLLTRVVLAGPGEEDLVHAVRGFSRISTPALWTTVATGAIQLFRLDRGALTTTHGVVVILKTLFVSLMVFVGVAARQFISSRVSRVDVMTAPLALRLRRALGIEAVVGVVVMALTAGLLTLTPAGLGVAGLPGLQLGALHRFQNQTMGIEVTVAFSEKVGANDVRIEVVTVPTTGITGLAVDFLPPDGTAVPGVSINYIPLTGVGAAVLRKSSGFTLGAAGSWTVRVRIGTQEVASDVVVVNAGSSVVLVPDTGAVGRSSTSSPTSSSGP